MENPNVNRITVIAPFKPLYVPLEADQSFADEIFKNVFSQENLASFRRKLPQTLSNFLEIPDRRARRIAAPWERLGLVYLAEYAAAPERPKSDILVNNLTQQIIFRVFLTNHSRKAVEWDQAGFALLKKIFRKVAKARGSAVWQRDTVHSYGAEHGAIYSKELHTVLKLLLRQTEENESAGNLSEISEKKIKRTLTKVLRGISDHSRTNISSDIRITQKGKALLKLLTVRYADFPSGRSESVTRRHEEIEARPIYGKEGLFGERTREVFLPRGSFAGGLDRRTLEELDKIIRRAYSVNSVKPQSGAVFRTVENSEHMVMLIPPARTGGDRANEDHSRQLPPVEYKWDQPRGQTEPMPQKRPRVINRRQTRTDTPVITGRPENFSREEINRLADKIYAQIETRVLRERRRAGM